MINYNFKRFIQLLIINAKYFFIALQVIKAFCGFYRKTLEVSILLLLILLFFSNLLTILRCRNLCTGRFFINLLVEIRFKNLLLNNIHIQFIKIFLIINNLVFCVHKRISFLFCKY